MAITALTDISGLVLDLNPHLTAYTDTAGTTAATDGQAVARVNDQTVGAHYAVQAGANRPLRATDANGWHYLDFDGADDCLYGAGGTFQPAGSGAQPFTIVMMAKLDAGATTNRVWQDGTSGHLMLSWENASTRWNQYAGANLRGGSLSTSLVCRISVINGASSLYDVAGSNVLSGDSGANTWDAGYFLFARATGGASATKGFLYRHAVYGKALSPTERTDVNSYLAALYASAPGGGGATFQPAWARNSNVLVMA